MEGKLTSLLEKEIGETNILLEDFLLIQNLKHDDLETETQEKNIKELEAEEEKLKLHLGELKKENFILELTINAWKKTLRNKLDEFREAEQKLDEIYNKIWLERETFCSEADKFNDEYGILSDWWRTQMNFLSDYENTEKKTSDDQKRKQEIEKLEKEIEEIKKEIEVLQAGKQIAEMEVHSADGNSSVVRDEDMIREISPQKLNEKKTPEETDTQINNHKDDIEIVRNDLYSLVDVEMVRTANRNRNRRKAFQGKIKTFLKH